MKLYGPKYSDEVCMKLVQNINYLMKYYNMWKSEPKLNNSLT